MNKKFIFYIVGIVVLVVSLTLLISAKKDKTVETSKLEGTVLSLEEGLLIVQGNDNVIYTFKEEAVNLVVGDSIVLEYSGLLDRNKSIQDGEVISYRTVESTTEKNGTPSEFNDNGIFSTYYVLANNKLKELSLEEKIGQLLLVRYPDSGAIDDLKKYNFGGFVFFAKDFKDKTKTQVVSMIKDLQKNSKIPLLTAVDEEGGKVVRVSSNPNLASTPFKAPSELYKTGGLDLIRQDTKDKSDLLKNLGLNVNLAPVVDVSTDPNDYMYSRSLQQDTSITSNFAKTVIEASKGTGVSYTLKHFPGYGNNADTHTGSSTDTRTLDDIKNNDLPPFKAGINAGAEAVLVSHNIVNSIDPDNPASLSSSVHNLLRNELGFTGIIITDDLAMGATSQIDNAHVKAVLAGNDLIITTDYAGAFNQIKTAVNNGTISENQIDKLAFRVLAWKYYKGLMIENNK